MDDFDDQWSYTCMTQPSAAGRFGLEDFSPQMELALRIHEALEAQSSQATAVICNYCGGNHPSHHCTINFESTWHDGSFGGDYLNNYTYPDYHHDWGYHPDSTWSYNYEDQYYAPSPPCTLEFHDQAPIQEESKSKFEELLYKFMASNDEMMKSQDLSIQNLENQMGELTIAFNNSYQEGWPSNLVPETDGEPVPCLQLDEPQEIEIGETSGDKEKEAEDPALSSNEDEPIVLMPQVPFPPKFKNPVSFAKPCPLGSHVIGEALCDIRASIELDPWCEDVEVHEKKADGSIVCEELQFTNPSTDTMEQSPSFVQFIDENVSKSYKLGDLDVMTPTEVNASNVTWLPRNGGFLKFRRGIG